MIDYADLAERTRGRTPAAITTIVDAGALAAFRESAGTGKVGKDGIGGPPEQAQLKQPHGVTLSSVDGSLFICDSMNDRVLKIAP